MPGKFERCESEKLALDLYEASLEGGCDDEVGAVTEMGWFGLMLDFRLRSYVLSEDTHGFFDYDEYDDPEDAQRAFARIANDLCK